MFMMVVMTKFGVFSRLRPSESKSGRDDPRPKSVPHAGLAL
jgi:hypothetical protein